MVTSADNPANDPFTRAFDAIQRACRAHAPLAAMIPPGNQINLRLDTTTTNYAPRKESQEDSDWPEQFLRLGAFTINLFHANSQHVKFSASYPLQIASGIMTVEVVPRVLWEIARALYAADPSGRLGIPDVVTECDFQGSIPAILRDSMGTEQWIGVGKINVNFGIARSRMQAWPAQTFNT